MKGRALLAAFDAPERLLEAVTSLRGRGFALQAFTPHPVRGLHEALFDRPSRIPRWGLAGAVTGLAGGYGLQVWAAVFSYPLNVAGRPLHSWQAFVPVTFELTVLGAALALFAGVFWENRLPVYHQPLFEYPPFNRAVVDRYVLVVQAPDDRMGAARDTLTESGAVEIVQIEPAEESA